MAPSIWVRFLAVFSLAASLASNSNAQGLILRSNTRLVQVSVIATGRQGHPVLDLTKDDFKLFDNGKAQKVRVFSTDKIQSTLPQAALNGSHIFTNTGDDRSVAAGITVIVLDSVNTKWTDQAQAVRQVVKFLQQVQPGDRIAIYSIGYGGFRVLHDFTRDASDLLENLGRWRGEIPRPAQGQPMLDLGGTLAAVLHGRDAQHRANQIADGEIHNTPGSLEALKAIAQRLEGIPGRKSLIWISDGFPQQEWGNLAITANSPDWRGPELAPTGMRRGSGGEIHDAIGNVDSYQDRTVAALKYVTQANIAIYPIEARGLLTPMSDERPGGTDLKFLYQQSTQQSMLEIAKKTGGIAFVNNNDITSAIRTAVEDSRVTYTLGFYPDSNEEDEKFHHIAIKLANKRGVTLRYRSGYMNDDFSPTDMARRARDLDQAFWSPLDANAIPLTATLDAAGPPGKAFVSLNINLASLSLTPHDGKHKGEIDILILQRNETGNVFGRVNETIQMDFRDATYTQLKTSGVPYRRTIDLDPRADTIRIVVRDSATGNLGSLTVPTSAVARY